MNGDEPFGPGPGQPMHELPTAEEGLASSAFTTLNEAGAYGLLAAATRMFFGDVRRLTATAAAVTVPLALLDAFLARTEPPPPASAELELFPAAAVVAMVTSLLICLLVQALVLPPVTRGALQSWLDPASREPILSLYRAGLRLFGAMMVMGFLATLVTSLGLILLVVPGLYVLSRLFLAVPSLVVEREGALAGLQRSWDLTKGRAWRVFRVLALSFVVQLLVLFVGVFAVSLPAIAAGSLEWLVAGIGIGLLFAALTAYGGAVMAVLYLDGRARQEAGFNRAALAADLAPAASQP